LLQDAPGESVESIMAAYPLSDPHFNLACRSRLLASTDDGVECLTNLADLTSG
jgi:hypothetical protein